MQITFFVLRFRYPWGYIPAMAKRSTKKQPPDCCHDTQHPSYAAQLPSLNRIAGQIEGVKQMIEDRRYCPEVLSQLRAVRAAINAVEANILQTHISACVTDALASGKKKDIDQKITELKELYRRFNG